MKKKLFAFLNSSCNKEFTSSPLLRESIGYANGYVAIPPEHRLHGLDYDKADLFISIHGGLTGVGSLVFEHELNELNEL